MKNLFYILFFALIVSSCSESDDAPDVEKKEPSNEFVKIKLSSKDKEKNIFDYAVFNIYPETDGSSLDLVDMYDSLVWKVSDVNGSYKIFQYRTTLKSLEIDLVTQWSHNFFLPGEYDTFLIGYKNNEVVSRDTFSVRVSDNKDFLGYNWADVTGDVGHSIGYMDVFSTDYELTTFESVNNNVPSVSLSVWNKLHVDIKKKMLIQKVSG